MSYFQKRRAEILGARKRRPRQCDIARQQLERYRRGARKRVMTTAAARLAAALQGEQQ